MNVGKNVTVTLVLTEDEARAYCTEMSWIEAQRVPDGSGPLFTDGLPTLRDIADALTDRGLGVAHAPCPPPQSQAVAYGPGGWPYPMPFAPSGPFRTRN